MVFIEFIKEMELPFCFFVKFIHMTDILVLFILLHHVALTWDVENWIPPTERYIFNFNSKEELKKWHLYSDSEYGGINARV